MSKIRKHKTKTTANLIPVKREGAEDFLLLSLISFGASVMFTRLFLNLTNFPQIGNSEFHVAHVLWGGLILFAAALFPLIFANRWALSTCAVLSGLGVGLFIDEVGKFITQSNNYFYPPAAPIIYAFFLITVLVYMRVRRPKKRSPRDEMYRSLSILTEVLDSDLDPQERIELYASLQSVQETSDDPAMVRLSQDLMDFVASEHIIIAPRRPSFIKRWKERINRNIERFLPRKTHKIVITAGATLIGMIALFDLWSLLMLVARGTSPFSIIFQFEPVVYSSSIALLWHFIRLGLEGIIGLITFVGGVFINFKNEQRGIYLSTIGLLLQLTAVDLLVFYLDQFSAAFSAIFQLGLLLLIINYRRRYLQPA